MKQQIKINDTRSVLLIESEPYVIYGRMGYVPVLDVVDVHKGTKGYLVITAVSLGEPLHEIEEENAGHLIGVTIAIQKESSSRMSPYIVERLD